MQPIFLGTFTYIKNISPTEMYFNFDIAKNFSQRILPNFMVNENPLFSEYLLNKYGKYPTSSIYFDMEYNGKKHSIYKNGILIKSEREVFLGHELYFWNDFRLSTIGQKKVFLFIRYGNKNNVREPCSYFNGDFEDSVRNDIIYSNNRYYYQLKKKKENIPNKNNTFHTRRNKMP